MKQVFIEVCEDASAEALALQHYSGRANLVLNLNGIAVTTTNKRAGTALPTTVDATMSQPQDLRVLVFEVQ